MENVAAILTAQCPSHVTEADVLTPAASALLAARMPSALLSSTSLDVSVLSVTLVSLNRLVDLTPAAPAPPPCHQYTMRDAPVTRTVL